MYCKLSVLVDVLFMGDGVNVVSCKCNSSRGGRNKYIDVKEGTLILRYSVCIPLVATSGGKISYWGSISLDLDPQRGGYYILKLKLTCPRLITITAWCMF